MEALTKKYGDQIDVTILDSTKMGRRELHDIPSQSDLIIFQSPGSEIAVDLISNYRAMGKKILIEYDDYSFDLSPVNPRYKDLGCSEVEGMWKDGYNGFDMKSNQHRFEMFKLTCKMADGITVTTDYLASKFRPYNKNVYVVPNYMDLTRWRQYKRPESLSGQIRIGWFGGDSHLKDLQEIMPQVTEVIKKYPQTKFVALAPRSLWGAFTDIPRNQLELLDWASLEYYPFTLSTQWWDIGLVPIEVNEFGRCKSNIKWLEYASIGTPSVCTDSLPYSNTVKHGSTGILAPNTGFLEAMSDLIDNPLKRKAIALNAYNEVHQYYDLAKGVDTHYKLYRKVTSKSPWYKVCQEPSLFRRLVNAR